MHKVTQKCRDLYLGRKLLTVILIFLFTLLLIVHVHAVDVVDGEMERIVPREPLFTHPQLQSRTERKEIFNR